MVVKNTVIGVCVLSLVIYTAIYCYRKREYIRERMREHRAAFNLQLNRRAERSEFEQEISDSSDSDDSEEGEE